MYLVKPLAKAIENLVYIILKLFRSETRNIVSDSPEWLGDLIKFIKLRNEDLSLNKV